MVHCQGSLTDAQLWLSQSSMNPFMHFEIHTTTTINLLTSMLIASYPTHSTTLLTVNHIVQQSSFHTHTHKQLRQMFIHSFLYPNSIKTNLGVQITQLNQPTSILKSNLGLVLSTMPPISTTEFLGSRKCIIFHAKTLLDSTNEK